MFLNMLKVFLGARGARLFIQYLVGPPLAWITALTRLGIHAMYFFADSSIRGLWCQTCIIRFINWAVVDSWYKLFPKRCSSCHSIFLRWDSNRDCFSASQGPWYLEPPNTPLLTWLGGMVHRRAWMYSHTLGTNLWFMVVDDFEGLVYIDAGSYSHQQRLVRLCLWRRWHSKSSL